MNEFKMDCRSNIKLLIRLILQFIVIIYIIIFSCSSLILSTINEVSPIDRTDYKGREGGGSRQGMIVREGFHQRIETTAFK